MDAVFFPKILSAIKWNRSDLSVRPPHFERTDFILEALAGFAK